MTENRHLSRPMTIWGCDVAGARAAVLAVHGRGQSPAFMQKQAERFQVDGIRFYAPSAAKDSWYPNPFLEPLENNEPELTHALDALMTHLAIVESDGFPKDCIVLWGFSQGACLLSQLVLTHPDKYGGLLLMTGGFLGTETFEPLAGKPLEGVPAILRSIEFDPWVPSERVKETAEALHSLGAVVDVRIAPGSEHIVTDEAMNAASKLVGAMSAPNSYRYELNPEGA